MEPKGSCSGREGRGSISGSNGSGSNGGSDGNGGGGNGGGEGNGSKGNGSEGNGGYGTKQSFSKAKNICNMCENAWRPAVTHVSAFLGCSCVDDRNHDVACGGKFALRTAARDAVHKTTADAQGKMDLGIDSWEHAFVRIPDGGRSLPQQPGPKDAMHVWMEGITKTSAAATLFMMVRVHGWCSKEQLRARSKSFNWPKEKSLSRPGFIPEKVFKGTGRWYRS